MQSQLLKTSIFVIAAFVCTQCDFKDPLKSEDAYTHSHGPGGHTHSHPHESSSFTFLKMNGEFKMNPNDSITQNDPRNPSRLVLSTTEEAGSISRMAFYVHDDMETLWADCGYEFIGSRPDPFYYPEKSKTSIWDVFKRVKDFEGDCAKFEFVISRSPHGDPIHMHLRYGDDLEKLLAMSNDEQDQSYNPWWCTYCDINRTTRCN